MQLGRAEDRLAGKGADAGDVDLVRQARMEATAAITELRDLARGISPPVLADRGLEAAVQSLADRSGTHVSVNAEIDYRPPPAVENAAYFVVAEALTNAAKHAPGRAGAGDDVGTSTPSSGSSSPTRDWAAPTRRAAA